MRQGLQWRHFGAMLLSKRKVGRFVMAMVKHTSLRLPPETLAAVDAARRKRVGAVSLNQWVAEAVAEKLEREAEPARGCDGRMEAPHA